MTHTAPNSPDTIVLQSRPMPAQAPACARPRLREVYGVATATSAPLRPRRPSSGAPTQLSRRVLTDDRAAILGQAATLQSP